MKFSQAKECIKELGRNGLEELIDRADESMVAAALSLGISPDNIEEAYQGQFTSDEGFAREMADQLGSISKDVQWPYTCIDWEHAAKELMYDYSEENGYYFRNL